MKRLLFAAIVALPALAGQAFAQAYPARPVHVIVGFTPGGGVDINARLLVRVSGAKAN